MNKYIGVDLGGTNVRAAVISEEGTIHAQIISESYALEGPEVVLDNISKMINSLEGFEECIGVGLGLPGPVDTANGCVTLSTNMKGFTQFPIVEYLGKSIDLPIFIDNDANVAGLAEAMVGAGKGNKVVYYVTHSTGIGGALIFNGFVLSGSKGYAGEIGNIIIDRDRSHLTEINTLNRGAVENEASGSAIVRKAQELIDPSITSAGEIFELIDNNNEIAIKIIDDMAYDLAQLFSTIAHICNPHVFVIGGGVSKASEYYWPKMINYYKDLVHAEMRDTKFIKADLEEPGIVGAAMLAHSEMRSL